MAKLKDRNRQIPNGLKFELPQVNYKSRPFDSFSAIVNAVSAIIRANPEKALAYNWPQRQEDIETWVDETNANMAAVNGWTDYIIMSGDSLPKHGPRPQGVESAVAGSKALYEWISGGGNVVSREQAEARALTCTNCLMNEPKKFLDVFAVTFSEALRKLIEIKNEIKLTTSHDASLGVCSGCNCPMKLKVWSPLPHILNHMAPHVEEGLAVNCWIKKEQNK